MHTHSRLISLVEEKEEGWSLVWCASLDKVTVWEGSSCLHERTRLERGSVRE